MRNNAGSAVFSTIFSTLTLQPADMPLMSKLDEILRRPIEELE